VGLDAEPPFDQRRVRTEEFIDLAGGPEIERAFRRMRTSL